MFYLVRRALNSRIFFKDIISQPKQYVRTAKWIPNAIKRLYKLPNVRQIGDPVLRAPCQPVSPEVFQTQEFQKVVETMIKIMRLKRGVGIAAPQIGVNLRIFAVELSVERLEDVKRSLHEQGADVEDEMVRREISVIPLQIFVNPELRVIDSKMVAYREGCMSMEGYTAQVPRALKVEIRGVNQKCEPVHWTASGWAARIAQHENDHLKGNLFVDTMLYKSLIFNDWSKVAED